jgi:hypothetical protein
MRFGWGQNSGCNECEVWKEKGGWMVEIILFLLEIKIYWRVVTIKPISNTKK